MNQHTAKRVTMTVLDRWANLDARLAKVVGLKFVVLKHRVPQQGRQDAGYLFSDRNTALQFGESHYRGDFAILALTERGSVDITPE